VAHTRHDNATIPVREPPALNLAILCQLASGAAKGSRFRRSVGFVKRAQLDSWRGLKRLQYLSLAITWSLTHSFVSLGCFKLSSALVRERATRHFTEQVLASLRLETNSLPHAAHTFV
jgi:hypothetical protein